MGQLLMILIVPPLVGIVTYAVFRFTGKKMSRQIAVHDWTRSKCSGLLIKTIRSRGATGRVTSV